MLDTSRCSQWERMQQRQCREGYVIHESTMQKGPERAGAVVVAIAKADTEQSDVRIATQNPI